MTYEIHVGDCLDVLRAMPDNSVDAIVTDPPYGLTANKKGGTGTASVNLDSPYGRARIGTGNGPGGFMGHKWDSDVPSVEIWAECLRVLKPGGHLLAFAGTRTQHRMAVRIEDAGFEIRDMIAWVYGSGFPKSRNISADMVESYNAAVWQGWGTALKPALEPITVARKPVEGTIAANVVRHGTGALNIDGCRVAAPDGRPLIEIRSEASLNAFGNGLNGSRCAGTTTEGRWPANIIHDGSDEVLAAFPQAPGQMAKASTSGTQRAGQNTYGVMARGSNGQEPRGDAGSAARFFYCAKASRSDRNEGLPSSDKPAVATGATMREQEDADWPKRNGNHHPTVKPTELMAYLVRLVTPAGGVVLDPFMGSGSTGKACMREGFRFIGCDLSAEYAAIAKARIERELRKLAPSSETQQSGETLPLFEAEAA